MTAEPTALAPIIVAAPVPRCGTTLVQRLLCSSPRCLIYGELVLQDLLEVARGLRTRAAILRDHGPRLAETWRRVLAGDVDHWLVNLFPDQHAYMAAVAEAFLALPRLYAGQARAAGRPVWGAKHPSVDAAALQDLRLLLPGMKVLYLVRDPAAALASAKARDMLGDEGAEGFCRAWADRTAGALELAPSVDLWVLRYEALTGDPEAALVRLEAWAGTAGIDRAVLARRINTFDGARDDTYQAPEPLDRAEKAAVEEICGALAMRLAERAADGA